MATTQKQRDAVLREKYLTQILDMLTSNDSLDDVMRTGSGTISFPVLDDEQNERFVELTVKIPTGERGGEGYDGYAEAEAYKNSLAAKAQKEAEAAEAKAKKIAKDAALREQKRKEKDAEKEGA